NSVFPFFALDSIWDGNYRDWLGTLVQATTFFPAATEELMDEDCATKCEANPSCQFWVRELSPSTSCYLRNSYTGRGSFGVLPKYRGNWKRPPTGGMMIKIFFFFLF